MIYRDKQEVYRLDNLTKSYGAGSAYNEVVKNVNLQIRSGEYLLILGPSGSGKSTISQKLAERFSHGAVINVDKVRHMVKAGYVKPWVRSAKAQKQKMLDS